MLLKKITFTLFTFLLFITFAEAQTRMNMDSLGRWDDNSLAGGGSQNAYNDIWGYADANGNEFAIFGTREYIIVVDVTNPAAPVEVGRIAGGGNSTWRDVKTYGTYAYAVTDNNNSNEGLMIIDLSNLPTSISLATQTNSFFNDCHNLFIDEPNHTMYAAGTNTRPNGLMVFDLQADPENPVQLADVALAGAGYVHDLYVRGDTAYCNHGNNGLRIWDFSTPNSPVTLGSLTTYPESGYNHSNWITDNGDYMVFCDETHDKGVKIMDITNFGSLSVPSNQVFRSELLAPAATGSIAHNPIIKGDTLYISYYHDGVQVFDISNPSNVTQIAYFDTEPTNTNYNGYEGPWGMYPLLPSGNIIASDQLNGLYIMRVAPENDFTIDVSPNSQSVCSSQDAIYTVSLGAIGIFSDDVTLSVNNLPSGATTSFSTNPVSLPPAGTSTLTIGNLSAVSTGTYNLEIVGTSPGKTHSEIVSLTISGTPAQVNLSSPANGATNTSRIPTFQWGSTGSGDSYEIEVASDPSFSNVVLTQAGITSTTHSFSSALNSNTTYYWHVRASDNCGTGSYSSSSSFTTSEDICNLHIAGNVPVTIPASGGTVTSVLDLTGTGTVLDLNVKDLDISHTWVSDLRISLRAPDGTEVILVDQICNEHDNLFLSFDDEASNNYGSIPCPPVGGASYQSDNPLTAFDGKTISGPWVLKVEDLVSQDGGSIDGWGLEICQSPPSSTCIEHQEVAYTSDLETWGIWNDGGIDCRRSPADAAFANSGTYCVRLRDDDPNSSFMTTDVLDMSLYASMIVDFSFITVGYDGSEDFWLQVSNDGGTTFNTVETWVNGVNFNNNVRENPTTTIPGPFTATTVLRIRSNTSNNDFLYIDDVVISVLTTELNTNNFDSNWGIWVDGGVDCRRSVRDAAFANSGNRCVRLRDNDPNSSFMTTQSMDYSGYNELTVDFTFITDGFDGSEDFWLQVSNDGGATFTTVETWARGTDFANNIREFPSSVISGPFTSTTQLRFRCNSSANNDVLYIDDVMISGCAIPGLKPAAKTQDFAQPVVDHSFDKSINEFEDENPTYGISELTKYPNPTSGELTIEFVLAQATEVQLLITDLSGKRLMNKVLQSSAGKQKVQFDASQLNGGYYFIQVISRGARMQEKFVVIR